MPSNSLARSTLAAMREDEVAVGLPPKDFVNWRQLARRQHGSKSNARFASPHLHSISPAPCLRFLPACSSLGDGLHRLFCLIVNFSNEWSGFNAFLFFQIVTGALGRPAYDNSLRVRESIPPWQPVQLLARLSLPGALSPPNPLDLTQSGSRCDSCLVSGQYELNSSFQSVSRDDRRLRVYRG